MANSFVTINNALGKLKNFYDGTVVDQFNESCPILQLSSKDKKSYSGQQVIRALKVLRNTGIGAGSDGGTLPKIGNDSVVNATIPAKFNWLRFGISAGMLAAAKNDKGAFVREIGYSMESGMNDFKSNMNRQLGWNGNGSLATTNAAVAGSNVITVIGRETGEAGDLFLQPGYNIDILTSGGVYEAQSVQINSMTVSGSVATLTLSAVVTVGSGSIVVLSGSYNNEVQGLLYSLDGGTSTIYGVDRATYRQYQGNQLDLSAAQLSLDALQQGWNLGMKRGGADFAGAYSDFDSNRFYNKLLTPDKRYVTINAASPDGGFSNAGIKGEFNGMPWYTDKDAPKRIFMLDRTALTMYVLNDMEWAQESGSNMIVQIDADSFEVRLRYFANLFNEKPAACVAIKNYVSP